MRHAVAQLVEASATSHKVTGSIPDGFTGIFHRHNPSGRTMALGVKSATKGRFGHSLPRLRHPSAMTCREGFRMTFPFHLPCRAHAVLLKATAQHGRPETDFGLTARVRILPAIKRSSTKLLTDAYQSQMQVAM